MNHELPAWAEEMRNIFRSSSVGQFLLYGNISDVVPAPGPSGRRFLSLKNFLDEVMFEKYDVVLHYDRGKGIRATRGAEDWGDWLHQALGDQANTMSLTREPLSAMELIDRYILRTLNLQSLRGREGGSRRIAVIISFAEFVVPRGEAIQLAGAFSSNVVKVLGWANDPDILQSDIITVLIAEGLHDMSELIVSNPRVASLRIPLPDEQEMVDYVTTLAATTLPALPSKCEVTIDVLGRRLTGLSRVGAYTVLALALKNNQTITSAWLAHMKKDGIERECQGLLEFFESPYTLDNISGMDAVKAWLRDDARLLKRGILYALPMGYLIAGRIGTGKTYLVQCWAGDLGIPCVVFKNFRDRWVGATESNLEKIFSVLHALGQVVVFVDEADQAAGKREGGDSDSGLSGRVYGMLAKEMSETRNRGRIIWVFATSRPDLLEVDLKRQGRLDVHIPLFPPETPEEMRGLMLSIARKLKVPLADSDLPEIAPGTVLGGNEIEGILVRALRVHELSSEPRRPLKATLADVLREVRPSAHTRKLEYMDLVAVKECTDSRFLPARFQEMPPEEMEKRIEELRRFV